MSFVHVCCPLVDTGMLDSVRCPPEQLTGQFVSATTMGLPKLFARFVRLDWSAESVAPES